MREAERVKLRGGVGVTGDRISGKEKKGIEEDEKEEYSINGGILENQGLQEAIFEYQAF